MANQFFLDEYKTYIDLVAIYPDFSIFLAEIRNDIYFNYPDKSELFSAWIEARTELRGNYFTHFDENGYPVDYYNDLHWRSDSDGIFCESRCGKIRLKFDIFHGIYKTCAMESALSAYVTLHKGK